MDRNSFSQLTDRKTNEKSLILFKITDDNYIMNLSRQVYMYIKI